jgi:flagellar basal body-associated protein FliL
MSDTESTELIIVLLTMGVLFILALAAVALFIRQWRKEHPKKDSPESKVQSPKSETRS